MPSWFTIPEQTIKPVVSFLLNRYVGELLSAKVSRDQLNIDLVNGTGSLNDVNLNVQYINEALRKAELPLELVDGYINSIVVHVPFMKVLEDSCTIEITGLEITVQPRAYVASDVESFSTLKFSSINLINLNFFLFASMFESMVGSMTTSMDLARSFVEERGDFHLNTDDQQVEGIDALARLIEIVLSRMKVIFHDTVIRIEHFAAAQDSLGIALEIHIHKLEFIDEILADVEAQKSCDPITSQPHSVGMPSSSDVCKIVRLDGVKLSTDIFTKPTDVLCKSVYLRSNRRAGELSSSIDSNRPTDIGATSASIYQSVSSNFIPTTSVISSPVQFAQFTCDRMFVKIRLKNSAVVVGGTTKMENVNVEMFLGSLNVFLTPTQVHLLVTLANALAPDADKIESNHTCKNKPMRADDFAKVECDLKQHIDDARHGAASANLRNDFQLGNWSGEDVFYTTSKYPKTTSTTPGVCESAQFTSIPMSSDVPAPDLVETMHWKARGDVCGANFKTKSGPTEKPDTTHCKIQFSSVWITLTHEDTLSTAVNAESATDTLLSDVANGVQLNAGVVLKDLRNKCDSAYEKDHLRFLGCPLILEYTAHRNVTKNISCGRACDVAEFRITCGNCELLECLTTASVWPIDTKRNDAMTRTQLLTFDRTNAEKPDFSLQLTRDSQTYTCSVSLRPCRTEFDVSLIDRLCNLIFCQPTFQTRVNRERYLFDVPIQRANDLSLRDDLFEPLDQKRTNVELKFELNCPSWIVDLGFPVPDMRPLQAVDRRPWWVRETRDEQLRLRLENVNVSTRLNDSISKQGRIMIEFTNGTGFLKMMNDEEFIKFVHACSSTKQCSIEMKWDFVARSLLDDRRDGAAFSGESSSGESSLEKNCFKLQPTLEGPFSQKSVAHENEQLTIVGSKEEITQFKRQCLRRCEMAVTVNVPDLRLHLPGKDFFTVLFNRIANDLTVWKPSGPGFHRGQRNDVRAGAAFSVHVTGLGLDDDLFAPCKSMHQVDVSLSESEISDDKTSGVGTNKRATDTRNREAHAFTFLLQCGKLDALVEMPVKDEPTSIGLLKLSAEYGELFVVSGYNGDEDVVYVYLTSRAMALWHNVMNADILDTMKCRENASFDVERGLVCDANTKEKLRLRCIAEPTPLRLQARNEVGDNFSIALRSSLNAEQNIKDILVTLGFRNTTVHYTGSSNDWLIELIDYFDVPNDAITGFEPPKTITELHVHGWCMSLEYRPTQLPYVLRVYIDSLDISSNLVEEAGMFRLHFILEESSVFLSSKTDSDASLTAFVCLMRMGFFELTVTSSEPRDGPSTRPLLELHARNDLLELRTCADSLAALASVVQHLAMENVNTYDDIATGETIGNTEIHGDVSGGSNETQTPTSTSTSTSPSDSKLRDMMASAMEDAIMPAPIASATGRLTSQIVDGRETRLKDGAKLKPPSPIIRTLNREPVKMVDNYFRCPSRRSDLFANLPPGYPTPLVQYSFRDISVVWYMYGGNDLGDSPSDNKAYSAVQGCRCSPRVNRRFHEAKESLYTAGGPQRDHSVCVSLNVNKMSFLHELFPPNHRQTAREMVTVQDVEMHDLLMVSGIHKLLYQYTADQKPRRTYVPMISVKMLHIVARDGDEETKRTDGECCLKVSILPLRLNIDQDTLQFLQDFAKECNESLDRTSKQRQLRHRTTSNSAPIMTVHSANRREHSQESSRPLTPQENVNAETRTPPKLESSVRVDESIRVDKNIRLGSSVQLGSSIQLGSSVQLDQSIQLTPPSIQLTPPSTQLTPPSTQLNPPSIQRENMTSMEDLLIDASRDNAEPASFASSNATRYYSHPDDTSSNEDLHGLKAVNDDLLDINGADSRDEDELCLDLFGAPNFETEIDAGSDDEDSKMAEMTEKSDDTADVHDPSVSILFNTQSNIDGKRSDESVRSRTTSSSSSVMDEAIIHVEGIERASMSRSTSRDQSVDDSASKAGISERDMMKLFNTPIPTVQGGLYFKSFTFSPDLILRIDYHGKRIHTAQGAVVGLLMGLSQLHCTELRLKEFNHRHGLLGFDKVVNYALMEWLRDIRRNQLYNIVGGVGPMHSLVQIALGIRDLFWLPVDQFRKDGHVMKGFQRGAQSFGLSTATATLELGQKLFGTIQCMAEFAFDVVNPDYHRHRTQADILQSFTQPADFREGVTLAVSTFRRGFAEMAQAIQLATQEERASGRWAVRGVLRQATPSAIRPVVVLSQATTHVLSGLRNQLRPDTMREEQEKWKNDS